MASPMHRVGDETVAFDQLDCRFQDRTLSRCGDTLAAAGRDAHAPRFVFYKRILERIARQYVPFLVILLAVNDSFIWGIGTQKL